MEKRRFRSHLIETFKFMKGVYEVKKEIFFNWMTEVEEYITKTWDLDLMKESLFSVIELLMIGIPYCHNVLIVVQ